MSFTFTNRSDGRSTPQASRLTFISPRTVAEPSGANSTFTGTSSGRFTPWKSSSPFSTASSGFPAATGTTRLVTPLYTT